MNSHPLARGERTLPQLLEVARADRPDHVLFSWEGVDHTIADVHDRALQLAGGLRAAGFAPGDRLAVMMDNGPTTIDLWFAMAIAKLVDVPINTAYRGDLLAYQLGDADVAAAVVDSGYVERFESLEPPPKRLVVADGGDRQHEQLGDLAGIAPSDGRHDGSPDASSLSTIIYTSGTTGPSKGVMISHEHLTSFGFVYVDINRLTSADVVLNYLPFFHIAGRFLTTACLTTGARMVLQPTLRTTGFWEEARRLGITNFIAVGGVCNMLMASTPRADDNDNPVRSVYAVPAPREIYRRFEDRFGVKLVEAYGSTETNLVLHTSLDEARPGSCGRPHPLFDVRIFDEHDREVPAGEAGEIVVRPRLGGLMMSGYNAKSDATVQAWRNLWFHTGDRARRDEDDYFWFLDRIKDSIRRRGENISSFEVERLVASAPGVSECAAVGVGSEVGEEEVKVVVVPDEGAHVDPEELFRVCAATMPHFMVPRFIDVVDELPRTPTSKVEKYRLRTQGITRGTWDAHAHGLSMTRSGLRDRGPGTPDN